MIRESRAGHADLERYPIRCPACAGGLSVHEEELLCRGCEARYPVESWGVSLMSAPVADREMASEQQARDREATEYDVAQEQLKGRDFIHLHRAIIDRWVARGRGASRLDAGCGTGMFTSVLADASSRTLCVDFSRQSLLQLDRKSLGPHLAIQGNLTDLPVEDESMDVVLCNLVIQHIPPEGRKRALEELRRVLKPDGRLMLIAYNAAHFRRLGAPRVGHYPSGIPYYSFSATEIRQALREAGLTPRSVRPLGVLHSLRNARGGWRLYHRFSRLWNALERRVHRFLPPLPSIYWVAVAEKGKAP